MFARLTIIAGFVAVIAIIGTLTARTIKKINQNERKTK